MSDDSKTATNEVILARLEAISAKVDLSRAESEQRGMKHDQKLEKLTDRVTAAEDEIKAIKSNGGGPPVNFEHIIAKSIESATSALRAEMASRIETQSRERKEQGDDLKSELAKQDRVQRGVVFALGLDYDALANPPANEDSKKLAPPKVTLKTLSREQKVTAMATIVILALQAFIALAKHI